MLYCACLRSGFTGSYMQTSVNTRSLTFLSISLKMPQMAIFKGKILKLVKSQSFSLGPICNLADFDLIFFVKNGQTLLQT